VCTTWGVDDKCYYLLDVYRERLNYPDLKRKARELAQPPSIVTEAISAGELPSSRSVKLTRNSANNKFPTATTVSLRLGRVKSLALIEVVIVAPFRRTVRGRANEEGNRVYLDQGWEARRGWMARASRVRRGQPRGGGLACREGCRIRPAARRLRRPLRG
jgi:hypothetical protein